MPKAKNRRKKKKKAKKHVPNHNKVIQLNELSAEKQIQHIYGSKRPYCKHCNTDAVLASDDEVREYKLYDTSYKLDFIFVPQCECYVNDESGWMEVR